ncbi:MAG: DUF4168 domain-containing protein [Gemmatimonadota bacterium]
MQRFLLAGLVSLLACAVTGATTPARLAAQQTAQQATPDTVPAVNPATIESFAKTHLVVSALRDRFQAQFAELQNKKPEVQDELHTKLVTELQSLLRSHGFSEAEFARMTRLVSIDSTARRAFEEAVAHETKK